MIKKDSFLVMSVNIIQVSCKDVHNDNNDTVQNHKLVVIKDTKLRDRNPIYVITLPRVLTVIHYIFKGINPYN